MGTYELTEDARIEIVLAAFPLDGNDQEAIAVLLRELTAAASADDQTLLLEDWISEHIGFEWTKSTAAFYHGAPGEEPDQLASEIQTVLVRFTASAIPESVDLMNKHAQAVDLVTLMADELAQFPVPVFGSAPSSLTSLLSRLVTTGGSIAVAGVSLADSRPVLAAISGSSAYLFWFVQPSVRVARRSMAERVAKALGTAVQPDDLT